MNIKITHNWLLEYLDTDATPDQIQKYLSLCGPSVEKIKKVGDDFVYDIEVTSNRVDMVSVLGIAQEAQAILPQFAKKAKLKLDPLKKYKFPLKSNTFKQTGISKLKLNIKILQKNLCSRFTAIVLGKVKISTTPELIRQRLNLCGIKSINNVIDISNYLMLAFGQPVHIFDYDSIAKSKMILRLSKKGEKIVTLDGKQINLLGGDIVVEDGTGRLIDLCGIMGGLNSSITDKTKTIVLFVQTYNPQKIRKTSMLTGQRTVAATYFEKGLDEERVEPTTVYGVELLEKYVGAKIASQLYDIYPNPYNPKFISLSVADIQSIIGVPIMHSQIVKILSSLGFVYLYNHGRAGSVTFTIPSYRSRDVSIKEDLIEEIARIYGYHNLPSEIQSTIYIKQPKDIEVLFELQSKTKHFLKNLGLHEVMNYSMISSKNIADLELKTQDHLRIKNTISEEIEYMRQDIVLSLIKNIKENEGKKDVLKFFEIAKGYKPVRLDLPIEKYQLAIAVNSNFDDLKGIIEALLNELNIKKYMISPSKYDIFAKKVQGQILIADEWLGKFGRLNKSLKEKYELKSEVFLASFEFEALMKHNKPLNTYIPINPYAQIKLDLTIKHDPKRTYIVIKDIAYKMSKLLQKVEFINIFENRFTLRFYFASNERNITEDEAKKELENIKVSVLGLN